MQRKGNDYLHTKTLKKILREKEGRYIYKEILN